MKPTPTNEFMIHWGHYGENSPLVQNFASMHGVDSDSSVGLRWLEIYTVIRCHVILAIHA